MEYFNVIAIDYGTSSIGFAVGQNLTKTAQPIKAIKAKQGMPNWDEIEKIFKEWNPKYIVVGNPLNMDGTEQEFTKKTKKFTNLLQEKFKKEVFLHDERLSTTDAKAMLFEKGGFGNLQKDKIDSISAVIILESWFNENN